MDESAAGNAVLIENGWIRFVGNLNDALDEARLYSARDVEVKDFGNSCVVPGFIDCHAHPLMLGQMMTWVDCSPEKARTIPDIVALLKAAASEMPDGVPVRGYGYEQRNLVEQRHPNRWELDQVSTSREVYLMNASGHGGVVNSYALAAYGVSEDTPDPAGGKFFRTEEGELTGQLSDAACNMLTGFDGVKIGHHGPNFHLSDEPQKLVAHLLRAQELFLSGGVTTVGDAQVTKREFSTYLDASGQNKLKMRVGMYFLSHLLDQVLEIGLNRGFGHSRLQFSGIKIYADGSLGGWTAYFPDGYRGDTDQTGQLYHQPDEFTALLVRAHSAGLQTATHAQSPFAIGMVIRAVEQAQARSPRPEARHRIEHCGLPNSDQIQDMARLGILPVNQPQHYFNWGEGVTDAIGNAGERFNPLGEFVKAGVPISISSDAPVAKPTPLEAMMVAVTRLTRRGAQLGPEELKVNINEALAAHTINAATSLGRESDLGSLTKGKRADFVVLGADPLTTPPEELGGIAVHGTWIGGKKEHGDIDG